METIEKCLKEWNPTIEALGQGKQTILIRGYHTANKEFLLYPTTNYFLKEDYINGFQEKYQSFVEKYKMPQKEDKKIEIKYYAKVEKIIEKPSSKIGYLKKHYIWTSKHVRSYLNGKIPHMWILRVYELNEPVMVNPAIGIRFAHLKNGIKTKNSKVVISDEEFLKRIHDLETV